MENHIFIYNEIGGFGNSAEEVQTQINNNPDSENIIVHLSSPGGEVFEGWTIGNILKNSGKKVTVIVEGICASIATYIALQADEVHMVETARFMIHNPNIAIQGEEKDLNAASKQLSSIKNDLVKTYQKKTNLNSDMISAMMDKETWLNSEEAMKLGFVDKIISDVKAVAKLNSNNIHKMSEVKEELPSKKSKLDEIHDKILDVFNNLIEPKEESEEEPTNINVELEDGAIIFVESEDGELVGKLAFTTDEEGNRTDTPAPEGTHMLQDGRAIVVNAEGVIEAVEDASNEVDEEKEALVNQVAELTAQLEASNTAKETLTNEFNAMKEVQDKLKNEMTEIKNMTLGLENIQVANIKPQEKINKVEQTSGHSLDGISDWLKNN